MSGPNAQVPPSSFLHGWLSRVHALTRQDIRYVSLLLSVQHGGAYVHPHSASCRQQPFSNSD